jgi:hypothetical protein
MFLKLFYILISGIPSILLMANKPFNQIHLFMQNKPNQTQFFNQSYQSILFHTKNLKRTKSRKIREKKLNQTQSQKRTFFTQSYHLSEGKIPRLAPFGITLYHFKQLL